MLNHYAYSVPRFGKERMEYFLLSLKHYFEIWKTSEDTIGTLFLD